MIMVIIQSSLHLGLFVTLQDRMGSKKSDAVMRSIADFEVPDVLVFLPSFKMFSCFFLSINSKTLTPLA